MHRGPRGARLTEAGRLLARHGETVDDACVAARRELDATVGLTSGRLRIGTFSSAAIRLLPEAMTALRHRHPEGDLSVEEITSVRAEEMITSGRLDVAVVATYDEEPAWPDWLAPPGSWSTRCSSACRPSTGSPWATPPAESG